MAALIQCSSRGEIPFKQRYYGRRLLLCVMKPKTRPIVGTFAHPERIYTSTSGVTRRTDRGSFEGYTVSGSNCAVKKTDLGKDSKPSERSGRQSNLIGDYEWRLVGKGINKKGKRRKIYPPNRFKKALKPLHRVVTVGGAPMNCLRKVS